MITADTDAARRSHLKAIRKYDPHHLILGVRYAGNVPIREVLQANGEYNDVISLNYYPYSTQRSGPNPSAMESWYGITKKPFLISEFSYRGRVRPATPCPTQHHQPN